MISRIARLRAKKGFTLVELIVVIAIIGVLTSITIAALSYDRKPTLGKGMAKDFYYATQDCLTNIRVGFPKAFDEDPVGGFYVRIDENGDFEEWGTFKYTPTSSSPLSDFEVNPTTTDVKYTQEAADHRNALLVRMKECFDKYLVREGNMAGTLFVVLDKFIVKGAYWSDGGTTVNGLLVDNNVLSNGYYFCAYPIYKSFDGCHAFVD